jgi:hypothetical protein
VNVFGVRKCFLTNPTFKTLINNRFFSFIEDFFKNTTVILSDVKCNDFFKIIVKKNSNNRKDFTDL